MELMANWILVLPQKKEQEGRIILPETIKGDRLMFAEVKLVGPGDDEHSDERYPIQAGDTVICEAPVYSEPRLLDYEGEKCLLISRGDVVAVV